ncbi:DMT family transporter [Betaproteobacteria bacterium]|nr:DMT family transporter [Betaproteobacteria bacterium]
MRSSYKNQSNFRHVFFMVIAMIAFAIEDAVIKQLAIKLPISQVLISVGFSSLLVLYGLSVVKKELIAHRRFIEVKFLLRMLCELISSVFFVITMVYVSLTVSSALLQIVPIMMTIGGFLLFKEPVSLKQWFLILLGLFGSLLVIQPGTDVFSPLSLFALAGAFFLTLRDLLTFSMSDNYPPVAIAFWGFVSLALGGVVSIPFFGPFCEFSSVDVLLVGASSFFWPRSIFGLDLCD